MIVYHRYFNTNNENSFDIRTDNVNEIIVTWSTMDSTPSSQVEYGDNNQLDRVAIGASSQFIDGGAAQHTQYIHRVCNQLPLFLVNSDP